MKTYNNLIRLMLVAVMSILTYTTAYAEEGSDKAIYYKVALSDGNNLNIRESPSVDAAIVGKIPGNKRLNVISKTDDGKWYEVEYNQMHGYAKSEYIKKCEHKATFGENVTQIINMTNYFVPKWSSPIKTWMTTGLLIMAIVIGLIHKCLGEDSENNEIHIALTSILSISVIVYILYMGNNAMWFFNISKSGGWTWFFINIALFLLLVAIQIGSFLYTKSAMPVSLTLGIVSVVVFFVGLITCTFIGAQYVPWLFGAFLLSQIIQCVIIGRKGSIWNAIAYFIIMSATVLLLIPTIIIGIIAAISLLVLSFIANDKSIRDDKPTNNYEEEPEYDITIKGGGVLGGDIKAKTDVFGDAIDESGREWKRNEDGTYSRDR